MFGIKAAAPTGVVFSVVIAVLVVVILFMGRALHARSGEKGKKKASSIASWKSYGKFQGAVLLSFLILGILFGWAGYLFGPVKGRTTTKVKLEEFHNLDLSHPVFEQLDVDHYSAITVVARATAPEKSAVTVTIYSNYGGSSNSEIATLQSNGTDSWARWDQERPNKTISVAIRPSDLPGETPATQGEILVYLSPK